MRSPMDNREGQEKSTPQLRMIGQDALGNGNEHFGVHEANAFCGTRQCRPVCDCTCHDETRQPKPCFWCANQHSFEGAIGVPSELRSVAGGEPPEDRGSDAAKACLRFIRQCVAGKCDELDLEVIRGEIDGVLRVAGGEPEQWISVKERLPSPAYTDRKGRVLTLQGTENVQVGMRMPDYWWIYDGNHGYSSNCVTHWRPLPAPPQGKEQK